MKFDELHNEWEPNIEDMIGRQFENVEITKRNDEPIELVFEDKDGKFTFHHEQDCCETVYIESIVGDLSDLIGTPILKAEVVTSRNDTDYDHQTWTFYKFATIKGYVDVRWLGESNGYYSEEVYLKYEPTNPTGETA